MPERLHLSPLSCAPVLWLIVLLLASCGGNRQEDTTQDLARRLPPDFPFDLATIPLSAELVQSIRDGLTDDRVSTPHSADLAARDELEPAIQRPESRTEAGRELYRRWHREPTNFLWITTAIRYDHLLNRTAEMESLLALPALADTLTPVGAFAYATRHYRIGSRGRYYARAADQGTLPPLSRLILIRKTAMVSSHQGHHLAAVRRLLAALPEVRQVGGPRLETRYWFSIALALKRADRLDDAVYAIAMGLQLAARTDNTAFQGIFRKQLATVLGDRQEYDAALAQYDAAAAFGRRENLPWVILDATDRAASLCSSRGRPDLALQYDRRNLAHSLAMGDSLNGARNLMNLADDFLQTGQLDSSLVYQQRAVAWETRSPHPQNQAGLPFLRAEYYCYIGDYDTADSLLTLARDRFSAAGLARDEAMLLLGLIDRGLEMSRIDLAHRALRRLQTLRPVLFDQRPDQNLMADLELATAEVHLALGELQPARAALAAAQAAIPPEGAFTQQDRYHRTAGKLALMGHDLAAANREFAASLALAEGAGHPGRIAESRQLFGRILLAEGRIAEAEQLFRDPEQDVSFGGAFRTRLTGLYLQGRARRLAADPTAAREVLTQALNLATPYSPSDVMAGLQVELGRTLAELGDRDQAKAHYDAAREQLARDADATGEVAGFLDDTRRQWALAVIAWQLVATNTPERVGAALAVANEALLQRTMPRRAALNSDLPAPVDDCTALYFLGPGKSYVWVGHAGRWRVAILPGEQTLRDLVLPVVADINQAGREPDQTALLALGTALLGPVLPDWKAEATLTIITDGLLGNVPWAALILPDGRREPALLHGTLAESPGLLQTLVPAPDRPRSLLAVGFNGTADQADRLRRAEAEATAIAAEWTAGPSEALVGAAATWTNGIAPRLTRTDVLHLATHARVREGWAAEAYLLLGDDEDQHPLTARAIRELGWAGDLVFLSSCDAGRSHRSGRGLMGLAGAFLSSGTRAVLASTGKVDDEAGLYLARRFYAHWQQGKSRAAALRAAQLDMIRTRPRWAHPFFWSRYRLVRI